MNIHEYQAKALLRNFNVPVLKGIPAFTIEEAVQGFHDLNMPVCVAKVQIHAGGRGKAGGVKLVKSADDVKVFAQEMLGKKLVTHQTGSQGQEVRRLYIEAGCDIGRELYGSLLIDRSTSQPTFVISQEGGVEIEEVVTHAPEKIIKVSIDPATGFQAYHGRKLSYALGLQDKHIMEGIKFFACLYRAFISLDAAMLEINPLAQTKAGKLVALDAKMIFDDNALYRQQEVQGLRDLHEEDPMEIEAAKNELSYIKLDGNIGCMVNGAGLAMATMDVIKLYGAEPANFLDVGGGATKERVTAAFKLIMSDKNVKGILVNIFGGIMRCDIIAEGILAAAQEVRLSVPLVVRLEGTNVEKGKEILSKSNLAIISAEDLGDATSKIVKAVKEVA